MNTIQKSSEPARSGATVVITHRVREGRHADYERWLARIAPLCAAAPGHLDWQIVRPIPGLSETYTVVIRFDTEERLRAWITSPIRAELIADVVTGAAPALALEPFRADRFALAAGAA